jgi:hypothetical protein
MASTKQTPNGKPPAVPTVADAEATVTQLQEKREKLLAERLRLESEMGQHSFAAHARSDMKAVAALDEIATKMARIDGRVREVDLAAAEANRNLLDARQAEQREQDKIEAGALRKVVGGISGHMKAADKYFAAAVAELIAAHAEVDQVHALGSDFPTHMQLKVNSEMALKTMLMELPKPWIRDWVEHLSPGSRRSFHEFWLRMMVPIENNARARLGEPLLAEPTADRSVPKAPVVQRPDAADRREAQQAAQEFLHGR